MSFLASFAGILSKSFQFLTSSLIYLSDFHKSLRSSLKPSKDSTLCFSLKVFSSNPEGVIGAKFSPDDLDEVFVFSDLSISSAPTILMFRKFLTQRTKALLQAMVSRNFSQKASVFSKDALA